jgi:Zn-finger protein
MEDLERRQCVDCLVFAPKTETSYTLISQQHGWRLLRTVDAAGRKVLEWRCPDCFAAHREKSRSG